MRASIEKKSIAVLFLLQFSVLIAIAPLRPDPHHDGIILAPSVAVSEGMVIYRDVFSLYGPALYWINALILEIFPKTILTLRVFNAFLCLGISILLYRSVLKFTKHQVAIAICSSWVFACAVFSTSFKTNLIQSPSLFSTFFLLLAFLRGSQYLERENKRLGFEFGVWLGLSGLTRIQNFGICIAFLLFQYLIKQRPRFILWTILGYLIPCLCFIIYLVKTGSLADYVNQTIKFPSQHFPEPADLTNYNLFLYLVSFAIGVAGWLLINLLSKRDLDNNRFALKIGLLFTFFALLGKYILNQADLPLIPKLILGEPLDRLSQVLGFTGVFATLLFAVKSVHSLKKSQITSTQLLALIVSIASVSQLVPKPDVMHLWWITPVIMLPLLTFGNQKLVQAVSSLASSICMVGLVLFLIFLSQGKSLNELGALRGTYSLNDEGAYFSIYEPLMEKTLFESKNIHFDCEQGLPSVITGRFLSSSKWYVNWGDVAQSTTKYDSGDILVVCDKSRAEIQKLMRDKNMKFVNFSTINMGSYSKSLGILKKIDSRIANE